jgi:hypothetical protein
MAFQWKSTAAEVLFAVVLTIVPWSFSGDMPVIWKSMFWLVAWAVIVHLGITHVPWVRMWPKRVTVATVVGSTALLFAFAYRPILGMWKEEQSSRTEGVLTPVPSLQPYSPFSTVFMKVGPHGAPIKLGDNISGPDTPPELALASDAGLKISRGAGGPLLSTPIRDRAGNMIAEVNNNHWQVYPPYCSAKNYDKHALEVKDAAGHVVLQIRLLSDTVQIQAEWHNPYGHGYRAIDSGGKQMLTMWSNLQQEESYQQFIDPMFVYPSREHWGEYVKPQ